MSQDPKVGMYIYGINPTDGDLYESRFVGADFEGPNKVGDGWSGMKHIFSGGNQIIYTVTASGQLLWYRHIAQPEVAHGWGGPSELGAAWGDARLVCAAGEGVIFAVFNNGEFIRYRHTGWRTGQNTWQDWNPRSLAGGWQHIKRIFAWNSENLYSISDDGGLYYYRVTTQSMTAPSKVGDGWGGFLDVFAANGKIYARTADKVYIYGINADGTTGNVDVIANQAQSLTRWFGCYTSSFAWFPNGWYHIQRAEPSFDNGYVDPVTTFVSFSGSPPNPQNQFQVTTLNNYDSGDLLVSIKGQNGKYLCSEQQVVVCNRDAAQEWERFRVDWEGFMYDYRGRRIYISSSRLDAPDAPNQFYGSVRVRHL